MHRTGEVMAVQSGHVARRPREPVSGTAPRRPITSFAVETRTGARWIVGPGRPQFLVRTADLDSWRRLLEAGLYASAKAFVDGAFEIEGDMLAAVRWWYARTRPPDSSP